ncbi:MAG: quinolinate synthase NadA [Deltaproteobacteria bacterium]|jgi:quinolinate synthase|nr:quinolinate synthase NadA [Deltaproteobacteria bacterium]
MARPLSDRKRAQAERALWLAKAMDVEILAHFYQRAEVKDLADYVGGSRGLYRRVKESRAKRVMVCGVGFMVGAMEGLRPDLAFLVPRGDAGCPMSDPVGSEAVFAARVSISGGAPPLVVADIKASREVRELSDLALDGELWSPDLNETRPVIVLPALSSGDPALFPHFQHPGAQCQVHRQAEPEAVLEAMEEHAPVLVAANSLCSPEVRALADFSGDSQSIFDWCASMPGGRFLVIAESGLVETLAEAFPESLFFETGTEIFCPNMKLANIKDVLAALEAAWAPELAARGESLSAAAGE